MVSPPSASLLMSLIQDPVILGWERLRSPGFFPDLDSVSVLDIFTDQARIPNCGTVFVSKSAVQSQVQSLVIIPKPKKVSSSGEEAEPVIVIQAESVTQLEVGVLCFHLSSGLNNTRHKKKRIFFIMEDPEASRFVKLLQCDLKAPCPCPRYIFAMDDVYGLPILPPTL